MQTRIVDFDIAPMGYKRMTRFSKFDDKFKPYFQWKDDMAKLAMIHRFELPDRFSVFFVVPMPPSWSAKKRTAMNGQPHQQKADVDNLCKAVFDALRKDDASIYSVMMHKEWGERGMIRFIVEEDQAEQLPDLIRCA